MKLPMIIKNIVNTKKERETKNKKEKQWGRKIIIKKENEKQCDTRMDSSTSFSLPSNQDTYSEETFTSNRIVLCDRTALQMSCYNDNNKSDDDDISSCFSVSTDCNKPFVALVVHNDLKPTMLKFVKDNLLFFKTTLNLVTSQPLQLGNHYQRSA